MIDKDVILLGKIFLENYTTKLNFVKKQVLLTETDPSLNSFEYSTGMYIVINEDKFVLRGIWPKSSAEQAGLDLDSDIIRINGRSADQLTNAELGELLFNMTHSEIELTVKKENSEKRIVVKKKMLL